VHHTISGGIERKYPLAKNVFLNIEHCVHDPSTLSTPRLEDSRHKDFDERSVFLRPGTSYKKYCLVTIILTRYLPRLKQTINMEARLAPTNQYTGISNVL